jgi:hypothetical protein
MAAAVEAVVAKGRHERWCAEGQRGGEVSQAHVNNRSAAQRRKHRNFGRRTMSGKTHKKKAWVVRELPCVMSEEKKSDKYVDGRCTGKLTGTRHAHTISFFIV